MTFVDPGAIGECDARTQGGPIVALMLIRFAPSGGFAAGGW
jgi:hypothetical protein